MEIISAVIGFFVGFLFANWDLQRKVDREIDKQLKAKGYNKDQRHCGPVEGD